MNILHLKNTLILIAFSGISIFLISCVSVQLSAAKGKKADGIVFVNPTPPFKKIDSISADSVWQNQKNGNTIAFTSECGALPELSLKTLETENISALTSMNILSSRDVQFNSREAIKSLVEGTVDGVPVKLGLLIFKKNNCTFTISFVGRQNNFDHDLPFYQTFLEGFVAP